MRNWLWLCVGCLLSGLLWTQHVKSDDAKEIAVTPCAGEVCPAGELRITRQAAERMFAIAQSEADCRRMLAEVTQPPAGGWQPGTVIAIGAVIVAVVAAGAFTAGVLVGR